jgi:hypothetical protein
MAVILWLERDAPSSEVEAAVQVSRISDDETTSAEGCSLRRSAERQRDFGCDGLQTSDLCRDSLAVSSLTKTYKERGDCRNTPKAYKTSHFVGWVVGGDGRAFPVPNTRSRTVSHFVQGVYNKACIQSLRAHCLAVLPRSSRSCGSAPAWSSSSMISLWQAFDPCRPCQCFAPPGAKVSIRFCF